MADLYIIDNNSFRVFSHYYPDIFPSFWRSIDALIAADKFQSVDEVKKEIDGKYDNSNFNHDPKYYRQDIQFRDWYQARRQIFSPLDNQESQVLPQVLGHYSSDIIADKFYNPSANFADPYLIAKAKAKNGVVVTEERSRTKNNNDGKIPTICRLCSVKCINAEDFMHTQKWKF